MSRMPSESVSTHAAGSRQKHHERHSDLRPAIEEPTQIHGVARHRSARPIAVMDFHADPSQAELAANERVGKINRRQLLVLASDIFGPRLIKADDERRTSIDSPDAID